MCISVCRCLWLHVLWRTYGSQRTICGTFSPAAMWFLGTEPKSSGLVTDVFTHWTILLVPQILKFLFWNRVLLSYPGWLWTHSVVNCRPWTFHPSVSFSWVVGIAGPLPCPVRENICVKVSIQCLSLFAWLIVQGKVAQQGQARGMGCEAQQKRERWNTNSRFFSCFSFCSAQTPAHIQEGSSHPS